MRPKSTVLVFALAVVLLAVSGPGHAAVIDLEGYRFDPLRDPPSLPADLVLAEAEYADFGYFLVQAHGPLSSSWERDLQAAGATVYGYVSDFTFLVGLDAAARQRVAALPEVRWVGPFHPAYKISPSIGRHQFVSPVRSADSYLTLMVRVFANHDAVAAALTGIGAEVSDYTDDGFSRRFVVRAARGAVQDIARVRDVWWIEELPEFRLLNNTTRWVVQSNVSGGMPLWDHGLHGEGQIVTMMDSGLDYNSCWFRENGLAPPGPSHRKVIDYSIYGGAAYDGCDTGHGSHVAGTVCGDQSYVNPGNYNYNGMAYKAKITVQDVGADDWLACSVGTVNVPSSLTAAYNASYGLGARVHTNSWGSTDNAYDSYCVDVDNAMWNHDEFLVCFAAGNSGPNASTVGSPGTAKNCVTVGATRQAPSQDVVASYSSRGPASDGRLKPTVMAPGGESPTYITSVDNDPGNPPSPTCVTASSPFQGTSMATPAVAGMALDVRQYYADGFYPNGEAGGEALLPTAALVKATLVASTADMGTADIPNSNEGWGRLLLDDALYFDGDTRELMAEVVKPGLATGETWTLEFTVDDASEPLVVAVVWTDYPGTAGSGIKLVNDLDLTVTAPGGTEYRGNVFSGGFSAPGGSYDRRNVEECARVNASALGEWTIAVQGFNVPHGPQPFAVVVNGGFADWPPTGADVPWGTPVALGDGGARVRPEPNPTAGLTRLQYTVPEGHAGPVELTIVDVAGRVVRHVVTKGQRGGAYAVTWDGRDDRGVPAAAGIYFATLTAGKETATAKLVVAR